MKAYLIDPQARTVEAVEYDGDDHSIYNLLDCSTFGAVNLNDEGDAAFIDEEGLLKGPDTPLHVFALKCCPNPLAGRALVLGTDDEGNSVAPRMVLETLRGMVAFPSPVQVVQMQRRARADAEMQADVARACGTTIINCPGPTLFIDADGNLCAD